MPVDVTVEKPGPGIISDESQSGSLHRQQLDCVTAHGIRLSLLQRWVCGGVIRSIVTTAFDDLELVPVKVAIR